MKKKKNLPDTPLKLITYMKVTRLFILDILTETYRCLKPSLALRWQKILLISNSSTIPSFRENHWRHRSLAETNKILACWSYDATDRNGAASWQIQQNGMCAQRSQISLCIRPIWSESPLSAWRKLGCPGWSAASLGAHATLSVLSWGGSNTEQHYRRFS